MKRAKTEKIDVLVTKILQDIAKQGKNYQHLIIAEWKQMLGITVSNATRKIFIKDQKLFVYLDSPVIKQEIIHLRHKILEHLNQKFPEGKLEDIVLR